MAPSIVHFDPIAFRLEIIAALDMDKLRRAIWRDEYGMMNHASAIFVITGTFK